MRLTLLLTLAAMASGHASPAIYKPAGDLGKIAALFPESALPQPQGLTLGYVVLGIGTQNYTCSTGDEHETPGTTGALATLYDIGSRLNDDPGAKQQLDSISSEALQRFGQPSLLAAFLQRRGFSNVLGHHFFRKIADINTPVFSLDRLPPPYPLAQVQKVNETSAPSNACPGANGLGAIKWLLLRDATNTSRGIEQVYRVNTAGGNRTATCKDMPSSWEVPYAAQYWMYGTTH